ncbi:uncharacterized protein AKAW2_50358A [Aspergillus luchuensis]|uniref:Uncharacterized protein n=1 Tax=Aspergillus kawachii TaxID=1069201 RepID=A0A7R7WBQ2_ASPKA|nr:uncharacterized protein AKAW2_50328S [Aspergillus luchuensis]XP_041543779.1 uncharacterized protein AKAW2_50358A [Aspergillus luchuensis]BCR99986.1 hypothetical protein AKAW2_50328S [Aspergillus luchuensis]BCS00017.1 hypothetical protein AKAW2_50358A [Aspergillus luchuensis]
MAYNFRNEGLDSALDPSKFTRPIVDRVLTETELSIQSVSQYDPLAKFTIESSEVNRETRSKYPPREFALNRFTECKV